MSNKPPSLNILKTQTKHKIAKRLTQDENKIKDESHACISIKIQMCYTLSSYKNYKRGTRPHKMCVMLTMW